MPIAPFRFRYYLIQGISLLITSILSCEFVSAGSIDGTYKIKRITNRFYDNGEPYKVPSKEIKESLFKMDGIVIRNNRLPIFENEWFENLSKPEYRDAFATLRMKGPRRILLTRGKHGMFRGKSKDPLVANFAFLFLEQKLPIRVISHARGEVSGNQLIMNIRIRSILIDKSPAKEHYVITGKIQIIAEKMESSPTLTQPKTL